MPGLQLRKGAKRTSWALYYRNPAGKERRPGLGAYPALGVDAARAAARELLQQIAAGHDPSGDWQAARKAPTMAQWCDTYTAEYVRRKLKPRTQANKIYLLNFVRAGLGKLRVKDVTHQHVLTFLERVCARKFVTSPRPSRTTAPTSANNCRAMLSHMFTLAESHEYKLRDKHTNPVQGTPRNATRARRRLATPDELSRLAQRLHELTPGEPRKAATIWALLLTGARTGEICNATVGELKDGCRLEPVDHKTQSDLPDKVIHLPAPVVRILSRLPATASGHLFHQGSLRSFWEHLRKDAQLGDLQTRAARSRPMVSRLARVLNHSRP